MFKYFLVLCVIASVANARDLLITDSFSLKVDQRLKSNTSSIATFKKKQFKYHNYFTWILKNLLNHKLHSDAPQPGEWAYLLGQKNSFEPKAHLSLMSSSLEDFQQMTIGLQQRKSGFKNVVIYTPLLDLCNILENFNTSTQNYVRSKFQRLIEPLQGNAAKVKLIRSNNVLSWMGKRGAQKKTSTCMTKNMEEMMMKFTFCPKLALLMQQEIPKEMLTTIANQMRELNQQTEAYVKEHQLKVHLLKESDFLDLSAEHFGKDCIHLNTKGHGRLAEKFHSVWSN